MQPVVQLQLWVGTPEARCSPASAGCGHGVGRWRASSWAGSSSGGSSGGSGGGSGGSSRSSGAVGVSAAAQARPSQRSDADHAHNAIPQRLPKFR